MKTVIRNGLIATAIALTIMGGFLLWAFQTLPEGQIPLHWNVHNEADRWGTRTEALWSLAIIPLVTLLICAVLAALPNFEPRKANLEKSAKVYGISWIATLILLVGVHAGITQMTVSGALGDTASNDSAIPFVRFVVAGTGVLFIILGNYLPKTRPNWFLGIRTPWTLSSNNTWEKTHRVGGRLFMLLGFATILIAFTLNGIALALTPSVFAVSTVIVCAIYSYMIWRTSNDRDIDPDYIV